jgi:hypothetical protein
MLLPSEIEAKSLIPAVRAILAKKLIGEYSLQEEDVAKDLGITLRKGNKRRYRAHLKA